MRLRTAASLLFLTACSSGVSLGAPDGKDGGAPAPNGGKADGLGAASHACPAIARGELVHETSAYMEAIHDLTVDATHLYYVHRDQDRASILKRVPLAGGAPEVLVERKYINGFTLVGDDVFFGGTRDDGTDRARWDTLWRIPKKGGVARRVVDDGDNAAFCCGKDAANGVLFGNWNGGVDSPAPDIVRIAPDGARTVIATTLPGVLRIVSDGTTVYSTWGLARMLAPVAKPPVSEIWATRGGVSTRIYGPIEDDLSGLDLDGGYLYFGVTGAVMRLPVGGGPEEMLQSSSAQPYRVRVHGAYVYWMTGLTYDDRQSAILRAPLAGGAPVETLEEYVREGTEYALDDCALYWTADVQGGTVINRRSK